MSFLLTNVQREDIIKVAGFRESEHPRDKDGKFTDKGKRVAKVLRFRKAHEKYGYTKKQ